MTIHLDNAFGLPHLDDLMKDEGVVPTQPSEAVVTDADANQIVAGLTAAQNNAVAVSGVDTADHGRSMDLLYDETLDYAQKVMDLGFNIDPARAPRMFEVATGLYKAAMDAKNSKMDAQLKAQQLMLNRAKFEHEKNGSQGESGGEAIETRGVMVEDRNELLKRLRAQMKGD
jgi:hypothetical protein